MSMWNNEINYVNRAAGYNFSVMQEGVHSCRYSFFKPACESYALFFLSLWDTYVHNLSKPSDYRFLHRTV